MIEYPHAKLTDALTPRNRFYINGRWASLYRTKGRVRGSCYSLFWDDEENPIQHAMSEIEVLNLLADLLNAQATPQGERKG